MPAITSTSNQNFVKQKQITNGSPDDVVFLANHTMKTDTVTPNKRQGPILQTKPVVKSLEQVQIKNMPQNMMGPILQKQQPQNFQDSIDVQANGQRIYGPPANWSGPPPPKGSEVFVGKVPRDCSEQELMPIFEKMGKIYELRIMMNFTGANRGFLFVRYTNKEDAKRAVKELNNYEIRPNKFLGVTHSVDNRKLWISGLPKNSSASDIKADMERLTEGVCDVILYTSQMDKSRTRGYAFVEYESHRAAALARRKLNLGRVYLLGQELDKVDWAEPENEVDEDVMKTVRVLFLRNLMPITTEEKICSTMSELAGSNDCVERTKKLKDYAFVHFISRESAEKAFRSSQNLMIDGSSIEVSWSKPVDKQVYNMRKQLTKFLSSSPQRPTEASILPLPNLPPFVYPPVPPRSPRRRGAAGIKGLGAPGSVPLRGLVRKYASASSGFDSNHNSKLMGPLLTPMFSNPPFLPEYFTNDLHKTWAEASQQVVSECDEGNFGRQFFQSGFHSHHPLTIATMFAAMNPAGYFPNILPHAPPLTMFPQQGSGVAGVQSPSGSYADLQELHQLSASIMNMNL